ncbi:hypothetical protein [Helicobacter cetorum]|uniref:hypothetical protein n=1 Tax=Helicobacter cetorum TaxID=138563 RepID=UPI000CF141EC|nr:hypothetical protein [Helicobacter cetorum]
MSRVICCGLVLVVFALRVFGLDYGVDTTIKLKKDEVFVGTIQDTSDNQASLKKIILYWTLYENKGLVINMHFNGFPYQFVLYKNYSLDTYNIAVFQESFAHNSHLSLVFKDFKEDKAILRLLASKNLSLSSQQP